MSILQYIGWQRILDNQGFEIAFTGMFIVFLALSVISLSIAVLPKVMETLGGVLPERPHTPAEPDTARDDEALAVAVGIALNEKNNNR